MFGLNNTLKFLSIFIYISLVVIFFSCFLLCYSLIINEKLKRWIENYKDIEIKKLDEHDLKRNDLLIRKLLSTQWSGFIIYIFIYLLQ